MGVRKRLDEPGACALADVDWTSGRVSWVGGEGVAARRCVPLASLLQGSSLAFVILVPEKKVVGTVLNPVDGLARGDFPGLGEANPASLRAYGELTDALARAGVGARMPGDADDFNHLEAKTWQEVPDPVEAITKFVDTITHEMLEIQVRGAFVRAFFSSRTGAGKNLVTLLQKIHIIPGYGFPVGGVGSPEHRLLNNLVNLLAICSQRRGWDVDFSTFQRLAARPVGTFSILTRTIRGDGGKTKLMLEIEHIS